MSSLPDALSFRAHPLGDDEAMKAVADMDLWQSEKTYSLPADGTRSMLFRFGGPEGITVGAHATDPSGTPFEPGTTHHGIGLESWADESAELVAIGSSFDVWYGPDIGSGRITAVT